MIEKIKEYINNKIPYPIYNGIYRALIELLLELGVIFFIYVIIKSEFETAHTLIINNKNAILYVLRIALLVLFIKSFIYNKRIGARVEDNINLLSKAKHEQKKHYNIELIWIDAQLDIIHKKMERFKSFSLITLAVLLLTNMFSGNLLVVVGVINDLVLNIIAMYNKIVSIELSSIKQIEILSVVVCVYLVYYIFSNITCFSKYTELRIRKARCLVELKKLETDNDTDSIVK